MNDTTKSREHRNLSLFDDTVLNAKSLKYLQKSFHEVVLEQESESSHLIEHIQNFRPSLVYTRHVSYSLGNVATCFTFGHIVSGKVSLASLST